MAVPAFSVLLRSLGRRSLHPARRVNGSSSSNASKVFLLSSLAHIPARRSIGAHHQHDASRVGAKFVVAAAAASVSLMVASTLAVEDAHTRSDATLMEGRRDCYSDYYDDALAPETHSFEPGTVEEIRRVGLDLYEFGHEWRLDLVNRVREVISNANQTYVDSSQSADAEQSLSTSEMEESNHAPLNEQFPSLTVHFLDSGRASSGSDQDLKQEFQLNSRAGIPIENDFFVGSVIIMVQPQSLNKTDPHFTEEYFSTRGKFEFQIQGRFKKQPERTLYCGAELSDNNFRLGTVTRGLSSVLLKLLSRFIGSNMMYSFGNDSQRPHISFPLMTAMQNIVITRAGETPPRMGEPFKEQAASKTERQTSTNMDNWNLNDTYSMSFSSSCIDLPTWRILDPLVIDLSTFWGQSPLRLVVYEKGDVGGDTIGTKHDANDYLLALQMKFLGVQLDSHNDMNEDENHSTPTLGMA